MSDLPPIASLWIGGNLSWLEQLCLKSFADRGHPTTLYSYSDIPNVPDGVATADASQIYPAEPMLRHARTGSPAIHADIWRLHLLKHTNAIWVDADMYCLRPFDDPTEFVFGWEKKDLVCNAVLGLPRGSETLGALLNFLSDPYAIAPWLKPWQRAELEEEAAAGRPVHITEQNWGFTGPAAVTHFLKETGEIAHALPVEAFYPISFKDRNHMIRRRFDIASRLSTSTKGVHFWARRMKPRLEEKEGNVPMKGSFLHDLILAHDIDPAAAPIPAKTKPTRPLDPEIAVKIRYDVLEKGHSIDRVVRTYLVDKAFAKACVSGKGEAKTSAVFERIKDNYNHERHFLQTVHLSKEGTSARPFLYMKNHKAACTTILATLLSAQQDFMGGQEIPVTEALVHKPPAQLMANGRRSLTSARAKSALEDDAVFRFTVIREPISRTISAFADKILSGQKQKAALLKAVGKPVTSDVSISQFIDFISQNDAALNADRHWRLQSKEISYGLVSYDIIGTVDEIDAALKKVLAHCFNIRRPSVQDTRTTMGHKSSSRALVESIGETDRRRLMKVLEPDLDMYAAIKRAGQA